MRPQGARKERPKGAPKRCAHKERPQGAPKERPLGAPARSARKVRPLGAPARCAHQERPQGAPTKSAQGAPTWCAPRNAQRERARNFFSNPKPTKGVIGKKTRQWKLRSRIGHHLTFFNAPARQTKGPGSTHNDRTKNGSTASPVKLMPTKGVIGKKTR